MSVAVVQRVAVRSVKNAQKTRDNHGFDPEMLVFWRKMEIFRISTATGRQAEPNTQTSPRIHPDKLQLTHYVGPPPGDQKSKRM